MKNRIERKWERLIEARVRRGICYMDAPDPPQPDPRIGEAAASNVELGKEALDFSKQQYEEGKPRQTKLDDLTDQVVQNYLGTQQKSTDQADDYLNYMKSTFRPIEQRLATESADFNTDARREELATQGAADVEQAAGTAADTARRDAARYGVNPADGGFAGQLADASINKTAAKVGVMNNARTAARAEGRALDFDVAGLGRNLPAAGATSTQLAMQAGNNAVSAGTVPAANDRANASQVTAGYGTAIGANQSAANMYQGLYTGQLQAYNSQVSQQNATMGGLGQLAGLGASLFMMSSKKTKNRRGRVSGRAALDGVKKTPVERWSYKAMASPDRAEHVGPMAEDFKRNFGVGDGKTIHVGDAIGSTMAAVKELAREVDGVKRSVAKIAQKGVKHA